MGMAEGGMPLNVPTKDLEIVPKNTPKSWETLWGHAGTALETLGRCQDKTRVTFEAVMRTS